MLSRNNPIMLIDTTDLHAVTKYLQDLQQEANATKC